MFIGLCIGEVSSGGLWGEGSTSCWSRDSKVLMTSDTSPMCLVRAVDFRVWKPLAGFSAASLGCWVLPLLLLYGCCRVALLSVRSFSARGFASPGLRY